MCFDDMATKCIFGKIFLRVAIAYGIKAPSSLRSLSILIRKKERRFLFTRHLVCSADCGGLSNLAIVRKVSLSSDTMRKQLMASSERMFLSCNSKNRLHFL